MWDKAKVGLAGVVAMVLYAHMQLRCRDENFLDFVPVNKTSELFLYAITDVTYMTVRQRT